MHVNLRKLCKNNEEYFNKQESALGSQFKSSFVEISRKINKLIGLAAKLDAFASEYDFDIDSPGNGYRGFVSLSDSALKYTEKVVADVERQRNSFFFRKSHHLA
jgi:hormone-sensitive lipase